MRSIVQNDDESPVSCINKHRFSRKSSLIIIISSVKCLALGHRGR